MFILDKSVILPGDTEISPKLRLYVPRPGRLWKGFLCAERGWDGDGVLPGVPAPTEHEAMLNWQQLERRRAWARMGGARQPRPPRPPEPAADRPRPGFTRTQPPAQP